MNVTLKSAPALTDAVLSSTNVPVYPCTAAKVTIDNVRIMITASLWIESPEEDPLNPVRISFNTGVFPKIIFRILGPRAPILESTKAPPIQSKKGPNIAISALGNQLLMSPSLPF